MKNIIFLPLLLSTSLLPAIERSTVTWGAGGLSVGLLRINLSGMNSLLLKHGYPEIPRNLLFIGGGGVGVINGVVPAGGYGFVGYIRKGKNNKYISVTYGGGGFEPGYGYGTKEIFVGIVVTIGGFGLNLQVGKRPERFPTAEGILEDPSITRAANITGRGLTVGLSLIGYYRIGILTLGGKLSKLFFPIFHWRSYDLGVDLPELPSPNSAILYGLDIYCGGPPPE